MSRSILRHHRPEAFWTSRLPLIRGRRRFEQSPASSQKVEPARPEPFCLAGRSNWLGQRHSALAQGRDGLAGANPS